MQCCSSLRASDTAVLCSLKGARHRMINVECTRRVRSLKPSLGRLGPERVAVANAVRLISTRYALSHYCTDCDEQHNYDKQAPLKCIASDCFCTM